MFCTSCGSKLKETDKFCGDCGTPVKKGKDTDNRKFLFENDQVKVDKKEEKPKDKVIIKKEEKIESILPNTMTVSLAVLVLIASMALIYLASILTKGMI